MVEYYGIIKRDFPRIKEYSPTWFFIRDCLRNRELLTKEEYIEFVDNWWKNWELITAEQWEKREKELHNTQFKVKKL